MNDLSNSGKYPNSRKHPKANAQSLEKYLIDQTETKD